MNNSTEGFWPKAGKGAFLLLGVYVIVMSFWCSHVGHAFRRNQLARDHKYHGALHELEEQQAAMTRAGSNPLSNPKFVLANKELATLSSTLLQESEADFKGTDALRWTAIGGIALLAIYFGAAGLAWRRRTDSRPKAKPAIEKA